MSTNLAFGEQFPFGKFAIPCSRVRICKKMEHNNQVNNSTRLLGRLIPVALLLLPALCILPLAAQPFQKIYTSPPSQLLVAQDLFADADGQCRITGEWWLDRPKTFVLKTAPDGLPIWCRAFSPAEADAIFPSGLSIAPTSDNGLIVSALKEKNGGVEGGALLKVSDAGGLEWTKFAPCTWRSSKVCATGGHIYYAAAGQGTRKVFLSKVTDAGQVAWERLLEVGEMDLYTVQSLVNTDNGDIILTLKVSQFFSGGVGPEHSVLLRLDAAGTVKKIAYFPLLLISALEPFSGGRIAFRCSAGDITWTGIGMMDTDFNWLWFKRSRFASMILLPNILNREAAKSGDGTQLFGLFYTPGGEKVALTFDAAGQLIDEQVYFSGPHSEKAVTMGAQGYVRASGIRADAFMVTKMEENGAAPNCYFPQPCGLILEDTLVAAGSISWADIPTTCLQTELAIVEDMPVQADDYCFDPGPINADFTLSDTVLCSGETIEIQRDAGNSDIAFGLSRWTIQGGIPATATGATVKNVRFNQPGSYLISHVFNVAGCSDTAFATITVLPPPEALLENAATLCEGDTMHLQAGTNPSHAYRWNTGDTTSLLAVHAAGAYSATVTNIGGCTAVSNISVSVLSARAVHLGSDTVFCSGASIRIQPSELVPGSIFHWNTGTSDAYLDVSASGTYILTASADGCSFADTLVIKMEECAECQVYTPTVFAPDKGAPNDVFQIFPGCAFYSVWLRIYDRWGNLVYANEGKNHGWDGTHQGKRMPPGVYVYYAEIEFGADEKKKMSGSVTLIR